MPQQIDARAYREVAKFVENASLEALTTYSEISFTPVVGDLQYFPRATSEARAAERGFSVLREQVEETVAILHALAAAADNGFPVPLVLRVIIEPYIRAFENREQRPVTRKVKTTKGEKTPSRRARGRQK